MNFTLQTLISLAEISILPIVMSKKDHGLKYYCTPDFINGFSVIESEN